MEPPDAFRLQTAWIQLLEKYGLPASASMPVFRVLDAAYSSPDRHYHTFEHLNEMFLVAGKLSAITDDPRRVQLAIWFHDAVYNSHAKDNEVRSAELAENLLGPIGVPRSELEGLTRLILVTAHQTITQAPDREAAILLDADLAILGSPLDRYRRYAEDIRREYAWVPDSEYRMARTRVLEQFLTRKRIYWNDAAHEELDAQARDNLRLELATLLQTA